MALNTELLETSFDQIRDREADFTTCFYNTLFTEHPEVKPLFSATKMDEQSKKLFASLVLVVNNLTKPDTLTTSLKGLGTRHVQYGALPEHYPLVGSALIKAMATTLQEKWTPEAEAAWIEAYSAITEIMLEGTEYPPEVLSPEAVKA